MSGALVFALAGAGLVALGLHAVAARAHLLWKVLGVNVLANGVFLILVSAPAVGTGTAARAADPVPQAMVLTGIVVAVSATALGLGLALRVKAQTGRPFLPEDDPGGAEDER